MLPPELVIHQGQCWTVSDLKIVVEHWYGVTYQSEESYLKLLHECEFSYQRTEQIYRSRPDAPTVADFEVELEKK